MYRCLCRSYRQHTWWIDGWLVCWWFLYTEICERVMVIRICNIKYIMCRLQILHLFFFNIINSIIFMLYTTLNMLISLPFKFLLFVFESLQPKKISNYPFFSISHIQASLNFTIFFYRLHFFFMNVLYCIHKLFK